MQAKTIPSPANLDSLAGDGTWDLHRTWPITERYPPPGPPLPVISRNKSICYHNLKDPGIKAALEVECAARTI